VCPIQRGEWRLPAACLLLGALLTFPGPVRAQQQPSRGRSTEDYAREVDRQLKEAEDADPSSREIISYFRSWAFLSVAAVVVGGVLVLLKVGLHVLTRMSSTSDPEKLAMSDPWVRAHLARQKAAGEQPPMNEPT
jgi:hypothetical protein